jgi:hypothetical protein
VAQEASELAGNVIVIHNLSGFPADSADVPVGEFVYAILHLNSFEPHLLPMGASVQFINLVLSL